MDKRSRPTILMQSLQRVVMATVLRRALDIVVVTEYPKSGGTWVGQLLAEYMDIPFPRNRRPGFARCLIHGHYPPLPLLDKAICVVRDGRDVAVSAYFHMLFYNDHGSPYLVDRTRGETDFDDYDDIRFNMPKFLEYLFEREPRNFLHENWNDFVRKWRQRSGAQFVQYESLLVDTLGEVSRLLRGLNCDVDMDRLQRVCAKYSFENQTDRRSGEEDRSSFLRKGVSGDWKNHFSNEAKEVFDHYAGDLLIELGYEPNRSWISDDASQ